MNGYYYGIPLEYDADRQAAGRWRGGRGRAHAAARGCGRKRAGRVLRHRAFDRRLREERPRLADHPKDNRGGRVSIVFSMAWEDGGLTHANERMLRLPRRYAVGCMVAFAVTGGSSIFHGTRHRLRRCRAQPSCTARIERIVRKP